MKPAAHSSSALRTIACSLIFFVGIAVNLSVAAASAEDGGRRALQSLSGTYKSVGAEDWGRGTFGTREFSFDKGKWTLRFSLALDPEMKMKIFEFRTYGTYRVLDPSITAPFAYNALFLENAKFVTLKTSDEKLIQGFGLAGCGLTTGKEKDISADGCALWKPVGICREDHDLLALDASGNLYFGARPADNDMCTPDKRPSVLLPAVRKAV